MDTSARFLVLLISLPVPLSFFFRYEAEKSGVANWSFVMSKIAQFCEIYCFVVPIIMLALSLYLRWKWYFVLPNALALGSNFALKKRLVFTSGAGQEVSSKSAMVTYLYLLAWFISNFLVLMIAITAFGQVMRSGAH